MLDLIRPQVAALRMSDVAEGRGRLQQLKIDEFVALPVREPRARMPYGTDRLRDMLREAVDDDGEGRRHFLRVRVTAWDGQLVVCVLVRVHTQGGMLVLEVAPHVLTPPRGEFEAAANTAAGGNRQLLRHGVQALLSSPSASLAALFSLLRTALALCQLWLVRPRQAVPDGPRTSVRELGGAQQVPLFHEMDISRYVKTVQDRISNGVLDALRQRGYDTGEFERQLVIVERGGIHIGAMSGGVAATGARSGITYHEERAEGARRERTRREQPRNRRQ
ncbi:hypothetical protein AB0I22_30925 [Streptomyces sp. NPDC050610]|uniref:hypothetical protein n=1 Tax=Streptomyces sp. NPDC050610 TaxID=3157097 RepID=UPI0034249043